MPHVTPVVTVPVRLPPRRLAPSRGEYDRFALAKVTPMSAAALKNEPSRNALRKRAPSRIAPLATDGFGSYFGLKEDLETLFSRPVDLVMPDALENPYFAESVAASA